MSHKKNTFTELLRTALSHYSEPDWLGQHSPLASPYFLGFYLDNSPSPADSQKRGQILQQMILNAAAQLWEGPLPTTREALKEDVNQHRIQQGNKSHRYFYYLLELRYLRQYFSSRTYPTETKEMPDFVNVSETRFYEHVKWSIDALGQCLLQLVNPTLRLENPRFTGSLIGRDDIIESILSDLRGNAAVAISGTGGVGKTSLATVVFNGWPTQTTFWYTFRPGLNDNLNSVLFSLAHFLHQSGQSSLWLQLLASEGQVSDFNQALGFLRQDLQNLHKAMPLLCFDEVDLLQTSDDNPRRKAHIQLLEFLEDLKGLCPLMLVGQRALLDTNTHYAIQPLTVTETTELLEKSHIRLSSDEQQHLHRRTNGNPRLLELYIALSQDEPANVVGLLTTPAVKPLFSRLWKRLNPSERQLLSALSVFRTYAPRDIVSEDPIPVDSLIKRNLIKTDQAGGIVLLEAIRELAYEELAEQKRSLYHQQAAEIRAQFGEYTSAVYHYKYAQEPESAIHLWYAHRDNEIMRGQTGAAHDIFQAMPTASLSESAQRELKVIQDQLSLLIGDIESILEGIDAFAWHPDEEITAETYHQRARASAIRDQMDNALDYYEKTIETLIRVSDKTARAHWRRGQILMASGSQQNARQEVWLIHYGAELLEGHIEGMAANYEKSRRHLQKALHYAQLANSQSSQARAYYWIAEIASKQKQFDLATENALQAMTHFERIGDKVQALQTRVALNGIYLNMKAFDKVIEFGEEILPLCQKIKHDRLISSLTNGLAEAHMEMGNFAKAQSYAHQILAQEIPRSRPNALYTLGNVYYRGNQDLENAEACFREGIAVAKENEDEYIEAYLQRDLGRVYYHRNDCASAITCAKRALELFLKMELADEIAEIQANIQSYSTHKNCQEFMKNGRGS